MWWILTEWGRLLRNYCLRSLCRYPATSYAISKIASSTLNLFAALTFVTHLHDADIHLDDDAGRRDAHRVDGVGQEREQRFRVGLLQPLAEQAVESWLWLTTVASWSRACMSVRKTWTTWCQCGSGGLNKRFILIYYKSFVITENVRTKKLIYS